MVAHATNLFDSAMCGDMFVCLLLFVCLFVCFLFVCFLFVFVCLFVVDEGVSDVVRIFWLLLLFVCVLFVVFSSSFFNFFF